jgi:hypothetical protein
MSQLKNTNTADRFTVHGYEPMQSIAIDFIQGLIPDEDGNDSILVVIDRFTRFVELFPMKGLTALNAAKCLVQHCGRYGIPLSLRSDGAKAFLGDIVTHLLALLAVTPEVTMAYSHEENSIVERANKEVMRHLRAIIFDRRVLETWGLHSPLVQRIMNVSVHKSTGFSPARLLFNNGVDLDRGTPLQAKPGVSQEVTYNEWVEKMADRNKIVLEVARTTLREHEEVHLMNAPTTITEFPINSYVLVEHRENNLRRGPSSKLLPFL